MIFKNSEFCEELGQGIWNSFENFLWLFDKESKGKEVPLNNQFSTEESETSGYGRFMSELGEYQTRTACGRYVLVKMSNSSCGCSIKTRKPYNDSSGIQRKLDPYRIKSIAEFVKQRMQCSHPYYFICIEWLFYYKWENTLTIPTIRWE